MTRAAAEIRGRRGEAKAAWFLRLKGWRIVGERIKTPRGEVDLIARRGKTVAFVEVKMRTKAFDLATSIDAFWIAKSVMRACYALHIMHRMRPGSQPITGIECQRADIIMPDVISPSLRRQHQGKA